MNGFKGQRIDLPKLLIFLGFTGWVFADVTVTAGYEPMQEHQAHHVLGSLNFSVDGDHFLDASVETPLFIRIKFNLGVTLSETLVDRNSQNTVNVPIYLPMRLNQPEMGIQLTAPAGTVSIIRWRAGEDQIWLRIQYSSSQWLTVEGQAQSPSPDLSVSWDIGLSAEASHFVNGPLFAQGYANLPFSDTNFEATPIPTSTLLCGDLSGSVLAAYPDPLSFPTFDLLAVDYETTGIYTSSSPSTIVLGNQIKAAFHDKGQLGDLFPPETCSSFALAVGQPGLQFCQDGQEVYFVDRVGLARNCGFPWFAGSLVHLTLPESAPYGFPLDEPYSEPGRPGFYVDTINFGEPFAGLGIAWCYTDEGVFETPQGVPYTKTAHLLSFFDHAGSELTTAIQYKLIVFDCADGLEPQVALALDSEISPSPVQSGMYQGSHRGCANPLWVGQPFLTGNGQVAAYFFGLLDGWPENPSLVQMIEWVNLLRGNK